MEKETPLEILQRLISDKTPEELEEIRNKYFPKDTRPKGWISIEDGLPHMYAKDFLTGTKYKVKYFNGEEGTSVVCDHNMWYYDAKDAGITHWYND